MAKKVEVKVLKSFSTSVQAHEPDSIIELDEFTAAIWSKSGLVEIIQRVPVHVDENKVEQTPETKEKAKKAAPEKKPAVKKPARK